MNLLWIRRACGIAACGFLLTCGCSNQNTPTQNTPTQNTPTQNTPTGQDQPTSKRVATTEIAPPAEKAEVEFSDPVARYGVAVKNYVQFEVKYRFTKGKPSFHYLCEITFDNGKYRAEKVINSWELKESGVIKDLADVPYYPAKEYEIKLSESFQPQQGYHLISNILKGEVKNPKGSEEPPKDSAAKESAPKDG